MSRLLQKGLITGLLLAVTLGLFYAWLSIPESEVWHLVLSGLVAVIVILLAVYWQAWLFADTALAALRRVPHVVFADGIVALAVAMLFWRLDPAKQWLWLVLAGAVILAAWLPWLAQAAAGPAAVRATQLWKSPRYWALVGGWMVLGIGLPALLIWWVPPVSSLAAQTVSAAVRFLVAGVVFTGSVAWLSVWLRQAYAR